MQVLQGILTNDLEKPGDESLTYGAILTPKGMIVFDTWVARSDGDCLLFIPPEARDAAAELFRRSVPQREICCRRCWVSSRMRALIAYCCSMIRRSWLCRKTCG